MRKRWLSSAIKYRPDDLPSQPQHVESADAPAVVAQLVRLVVERELADDIGELGQRSGVRLDARLGRRAEAEAEVGVQDLLRARAARRALKRKHAGPADRGRRVAARVGAPARLGRLTGAARPRARLGHLVAVRILADANIAASAFRPARADRRVRVSDVESAVLAIARARGRCLVAHGRVDDRRRLPRAPDRPVRSRGRSRAEVGAEQIAALLVGHEFGKQGLSARVIRGDERAEEGFESAALSTK